MGKLASTLLLACLAVDASTTYSRMAIAKPAPPATTPVLAFTTEQEYQSGESAFVRYFFEVANADAFPDALFAPAPELPPCGANKNASRTWVDVYAEDGQRLNGFCAFGKSADLKALWFALPKGTVPPGKLYIEMKDRKLDATYRSKPTAVLGPRINRHLPHLDVAFDSHAWRLRSLQADPRGKIVELALRGSTVLLTFGEVSWPPEAAAPADTILEASARVKSRTSAGFDQQVADSPLRSVARPGWTCRHYLVPKSEQAVEFYFGDCVSTGPGFVNQVLISVPQDVDAMQVEAIKRVFVALKDKR